jgi:hypothetical protein
VAAATVLVFPSLFEGYGMPVVEAMAAGTPVIASSDPSIDEATGGAAVRFDPCDAAALAEELRGVADLHATLRPAGSFDQLIAVAEGRIFVEGRAERERLATPAADRADAAAFALVSATEAGEGVDEALVALDADLVGMSPELRSTMLDAYTRVVDGVRRPLRALDVIEEERMETIAGLLELGPRMGLHVSVAPALASTLVAGRILGARATGLYLMPPRCLHQRLIDTQAD